MGVLKNSVTHLFQAIYRRPYAKKKANHFGARNPSRWFFPTPNKWKTLTKALVVCCIEGIILPSYVGITLSKYKDPHKPIITMFWTLLKCCEMSFSLEIFGFWRFFGGFWSFLTFRDLIFLLWNFDMARDFVGRKPDASWKTWISSTLRRISNRVG